MESPSLPTITPTKAVLYSLLLIVWWIGVWGIADTVIHLVFKGETMKELGVYITFVAIVLVVVFLNPEFVQRF